MDIFTIKEKIAQWQSIFHKNPDNYTVIKIIQEIRNFYSSLSDNHKSIFLTNFGTIKKRILDYVYSNDSNVRNEVIKLALLFQFADITRDVVEFLKIEKNQESLLLYLDYIKNFNLIGYTQNLFEFSKKQDISLIVKLKSFYVLISFLPSVKAYKNYLEYIFEELKRLQESYAGSKSASFLLNALPIFFDQIFKELLNYHFKEKEIKVVELFYNFFTDLFLKLQDYLDSFVNYFCNSDYDEDKIVEVIVWGFVIICLIQIILSNVDYEKKTEFDFRTLIELFIKIFQKVRKKQFFLLLMLNILDEYKIFNDFKNILFSNDNAEKVVDLLISMLDHNNHKLSTSILEFIKKFSFNLNEDHLKKISDFSKKIDNDLVLLQCLDFMDKYNYYEDLFMFLKYSNSYGLEVRNKLKEMMNKIIRSKSKETEN